ncbi:2',3'-cyclic-nucleotide 3'-phosphodiesterase [Anguilla rostrata]|uniref:2',3'-cyclic-nucleotide 3'-phosphodiesterase n=1 Tax=Anguilla rostrata TaxID=7938 RepID=UPI0030D5E4E1
MESGKLTETEAKQEAESGKNPKMELEKQEESPLGTQEEQEQQASEVETPAPIVPGSLAFAILEDEHTKTALCSSHTLIILRGLPGSGKTRLANAIRDHYQSLCTIVSADDYSVKPESSSVEQHKAIDEAVVASCTSGTAVVVVDDTNHAHGRLARLVELAEQHQYYTLFLEPRTEWSQDVEQLVQKTRRGLDKNQIQALKGPLEEACLPLFFGWFLCPTFQDKLRNMAKDFLKNLQGLEDFKKHLSDFTGEAEKEVVLEQYFQDKGMLHCTTKFCDYGKAEGSKEYAEQLAVKDRYGSMSELKLSALFLTPRTLGARVSLTEEQLQLWPAGAEKEAMPDADLPAGSRAHITLGCAEGVEPLQTGLDLLELVLLQQQGQEGEQVQDLDLGPLAYYGKGMWVLNLRESSLARACFCSYYGPKKDDGKKEAEKKKKFKCNLQ